MALFKCKMCGGALEISNNETVVTCEYCGTQQTLPRLDDDKRANMYDRANHFRRNNEFDKAMGIYEQILNEDNSDAEAYWSLVLCRYGIEYVEDPSSHKRIPTVNRAQFTSIFDDDNYKSAIEYADSHQKEIYEKEAKAINEIQKGILSISQKEEPFDVFICYKETDNNGRRTPDSVLANELYHQLKQEGFKVFFSRITLEDKLGSAYEPYIFAALNSSKVMVVLGTKQEYFNAVWVKNEWGRFLALIKNGEKKMLIPAYKDMDPYDLPEEFSHLQAQDMSKLGFMQDIIRGIKKITEGDAPKTTVLKETVIEGGNVNIAPLLERAFMFLEDGEWQSAEEYCEKVLDLDPKCAKAYLGKLMAELNIHKEDELCNCKQPFDSYANYAKVMRFSDDALRKKLESDIEHIRIRNENDRLSNIYARAIQQMNTATSEEDYKTASSTFESISEYKDAKELSKKCLEKAEAARKDKFLSEGKSKMFGRNIHDYEAAIKIFESISGWKSADELIVECKNGIEQIKAQREAERLEKERLAAIKKAEEEARRKKIKKIAIISTLTVCVLIALLFLWWNVKYNTAIDLMNDGKYIEAYEAFVALGDYKDSKDKADSIFDKYKAEKLKTAKVGDYVFLGKYEQDNNTSNGEEDIEWLVLEIKEGKALLISKYALDCKQYNTTGAKVTWETCTLREWLNNDFVNSAFSGDEKAMIPTVTVSADKNPMYDTNPGNATQDQIFLLSITEVNKYFSSDSERKCEPTEHAVANGAFENNSSCCWWWLRSPGCVQDSAARVITGGIVGEGGGSVDNGFVAVRPALWVNLES
ncbi:MAG: toll/interleukin-1 receptor domain-containing protein [Ruminococcaceae bacterium]|nr:toll/interleukin-1 receptor domain-containing protein [Oscillospiraceae bacterium]